MPIVRTAFISNRVYSLGGRLMPISVRDQLVRAHMFIDRALDQNVLDPGSPLPLLIVGGGIAGVAAAVYARNRGLDVILVERETTVLSLQAQCTTRHLCPTQYDWPMSHHPEGKFPLDRHPINAGVDWNRGLAQTQAGRLFAELYRAGPNAIDVRTSSECLVHHQSARWDRIEVVISPTDSPASNTPTRTEVHAVLHTIGFGSEVCTIPHFTPGVPRVNGSQPEYVVTGFRFWETDSFALPRCGIPETAPYKVLIAGGGDGALQDFLRLVCLPNNNPGFYASNLLTQLFPNGGIGRLPIDQLCKVKELLDNANREFLSGSDDENDIEYLTLVHNGMSAVVREILGGPTGPVIRTAILDSLRPDLPDELHFVYTRNYFVHCYGLNRFLSLLVLEVLTSEWPDRFLTYPGRRVADIEAHDPGIYVVRPGPRVAPPVRTHGHMHRVTLNGDDRPRFDANVFVLRIGLDTTDMNPSFTEVQRRQLLPYSYACR